MILYPSCNFSGTGFHRVVVCVNRPSNLIDAFTVSVAETSKWTLVKSTVSYEYAFISSTYILGTTVGTDAESGRFWVQWYRQWKLMPFFSHCSCHSAGHGDCHIETFLERMMVSWKWCVLKHGTLKPLRYLTLSPYPYLGFKREDDIHSLQVERILDWNTL